MVLLLTEIANQKHTTGEGEKDSWTPEMMFVVTPSRHVSRNTEPHMHSFTHTETFGAWTFTE